MFSRAYTFSVGLHLAVLEINAKTWSHVPNCFASCTFPNFFKIFNPLRLKIMWITFRNSLPSNRWHLVSISKRPVSNTVLGNNCCFLWEVCETHTRKYTVWAKCRVFNVYSSAYNCAALWSVSFFYNTGVFDFPLFPIEMAVSSPAHCSPCIQSV